VRFVLTDDSVDRHYERVLVSGVKTDNFEKNPVMLYQHRQDSFWSDKFAPLPIGYWKDIKKEGNKITAEPVFNDTELGQQIKDLVSHGTLNACSIGFRAISYSNDPNVMMPGQKYATITESELLECSIVMIPANPNAVAQKSFEVDGTKYRLSGTNSSTPEQMAEILKAVENFHPKTQFDMTKKFEEITKSITEGFDKVMKAMAEGMKSAGASDADKAAQDTKTKEVNDLVTEIQNNVKLLQDENETLGATNKKLEDENAGFKKSISEKDSEIAKLSEKLLNRGTEDDIQKTGGEEGQKEKYSYTKNVLKITK